MIELLIILLIFSFSANILALWYVFRLLRKYFPISEDLEDLFERLDEYHFHIKTVSEMESFYGDEILMNLLRHSRTIVEEVDQFRAAYSLLDEYEEIQEFDGEELNEVQEKGEFSNEIEQEVLGVVHNHR